jgi:hypothetical protein
MIQAHIEKERAVPLWAAVGAPLLGIPLMVALLSLVAPVQDAPATEPDASQTTEQMEVEAVDRTIGTDEDSTEYPPVRS